jgi:transcription elongation GreA/GreB family factor
VSVAFRREEDEAHLEPRFELPIPPGPNLVTRRGLALLEEQVAALEATVPTLEGNAQAEAARDLRYWRTRLATAELAAAPPDGTAGIGTRVRFRLAGQARALAIVGHDEADPQAGRIAFSAPLARALAGLGPGEADEYNGKPIEVEAVEPL